MLEQGDLEEFWGTWKFQDHREGTEVNLHVYLSGGNIDGENEQLTHNGLVTLTYDF